MRNKTLAEILEAVKSNEPVTEEDLRMGILALDALMTFDFRAFMNLYKAEKESKKPNLVYSAIWQFDERFGRIKRAMRKAPLEYIGQNNHPSNPEYQKRRAISNKLVEMIIK